VKCADLVKAQEIFIQSEKKPAAMYASMLNGKYLYLTAIFTNDLFFLFLIQLGLSENNRAEEALNLFRRMNVEPNEYIFSIVFKICGQLADEQSLKFGKNLFNTMPTKYQNNPIILTSALYMFVHCGDISNSEELFSRIEKNIVTYGVMMIGKKVHLYYSKSFFFFS
jgi:hypothetical protein